MPGENAKILRRIVQIFSVAQFQGKSGVIMQIRLAQGVCLVEFIGIARQQCVQRGAVSIGLLRGHFGGRVDASCHFGDSLLLHLDEIPRHFPLGDGDYRRNRDY